MKKILSLMVMLLLVLSLLVSCGGSNDDADETNSGEPTVSDLVEAIKKTDALTSVDMSYDMDMKMVMEGMEIETPVSGTSKTAEVDGKTVVEATMTMDIMGMSSETKVFIVDGYAYTETMGEKVKMPAEDAESSVPQFDLSTFTEDSIESIETSDDQNGTKFAVKFKEGSNNATLDAILGEENGADAGVTYKDVEISFVVNNDGYVVSCSIKFEAEVTDEIMGSYSAVADYTITYNNPGEDVQITLPDDLDTYEDAYGDISLDDFEDFGDEEILD